MKPYPGHPDKARNLLKFSYRQPQINGKSLLRFDLHREIQVSLVILPNKEQGFNNPITPKVLKNTAYKKRFLSIIILPFTNALCRLFS